MQPVWNEPALTFTVPHEGKPTTYLVASELHLGIESELARQGAYLRSRSRGMSDRLNDLRRAHKAQRLILLGDVKHKVTHLSPQEKRDVPAFFAALETFDRVDIALGNHDTGLRALLPRHRFGNVRIHGAPGFLVDADAGPPVACLHGHAWPRPSLLSAGAFLVGHTHAAVAVVDEQGRRTTEWAWIRGRLDATAVHAKYGRRCEARVIVFPPFNPLCGGTAVNQEGLLGPFRRLVRPETADVVLLDGRPLGTLAELSGTAPPETPASNT